MEIFKNSFINFCIHCGSKKINKDCNNCFDNFNALKVFEEEE